MLFIGIEIMSIPLYILTGSEKRNLKGNEAALKYFLMGSFSTGLMLMGIALMYGGTGTFSLDVAQRTATGSLYKGTSFLEITGLLFLMVSMALRYLLRLFISGRRMCTTEHLQYLLLLWQQLSKWLVLLPSCNCAMYV